MSVSRRLDELQSQCKSLGLSVVQTKSRVGKQDYIDALSRYFYQRDPRKGQYGFEFILNKIQSPMLCQRIQNLKDYEQKEIWREGSEWIFEEKLDGARIIITYDPEEGFDFYSRHISVEDYLPISYKATVWLNKEFKGVFKTPFVVDSEVVSKEKNINTILGSRGVITETQLQATTALLAMDPARSIPIQKETGGFIFYVFDVLQVGDRSVMEKPLFERKAILSKIVEAMKREGFPVGDVRSTEVNKRDFYDSIIASGGEGCVAKYKRSVYTPTETRGRQGWVKIKKSVSQAIGEDIDAFITGYQLGEPGSAWENLVGSLEVSVILTPSGKEHHIANVSNIPLEKRREMTEIGPDGKPRLKSCYYDQVVTIEGMDISSRALRFVHANITAWRDGVNSKPASQCVFPEEMLRKLVQ